MASNNNDNILLCIHPGASCSTEGDGQQTPSAIATRPIGQIAITGLPSVVCVSKNLLANPPCNDHETGVMFLNGTFSCLAFIDFDAGTKVNDCLNGEIDIGYLPISFDNRIILLPFLCSNNGTLEYGT
jgi:hypothetical protein